MFRLVLLWLLFSTAILGCRFCGAASSNTTGVCIQSEKDALLEVKSSLIDPSNRLASWSKVNADCCIWHGVVCHRLTGHVLELHLGSNSFHDYASSLTNSLHNNYIAYYSMYVFRGNLNPSLLKLKHLRYLDLSNNDFGEGPIPEFLSSIESLRSLNLSMTMFGGNVPHQLGNLSNLQYLNLNSGPYFNYSHVIARLDSPYHLYSDDLHWLSSLSSLKFLDLSGVKLAKASNWLNDINQLSSLRELHLSYCQLPNAMELLQSNLSSLSTVNLSGNIFLSTPLILSWIYQLQSLEILYLSENRFSGTFPSGLQNLSALVELDLSLNQFESSIPKWLYAFGSLKVLDLYGNRKLQGDISIGFGNLTSLMFLDLANTGLVGRIPRSFENLCNLRSLILDNIKLKQEISEALDILVRCASNSLETLSLSECDLYGTLINDLGQFKPLVRLFLESNSDGVFPLSLGRLQNLKTLVIDQNLLVGDVYEAHFENLSKLICFSASINKLTLRVGSKWLPPFQQISELYMGSWHLGSLFPTWVRSLNQLEIIDISDTGISSAIPNWFWNLTTLNEIHLSQNKITQVLSNKNQNSFELSVPLLDLSANVLTGPLPSISSSVAYLWLSNNSLSGTLADFLCSGINRNNQLRILDVERNLLSGEMPDCWMHWSQLGVVKLSNNKFHGSIPQSFGTLKFLRSLSIKSDNLSGKLPASLKNCSQLRKLDIADNQLEGSLPDWIGRLFSMVILVLRGNKFHGQIPDNICHLISLQILDLAANYFNGSIPSCVGNFSAMVGTKVIISASLYFVIGEIGAVENQEIIIKGGALEYSTTLNLVRTIDLSENNLSGVIPRDITKLTRLISLNLSHNLLFGTIPNNIGSMKALLALDFSQNKLSGNIPQSLVGLNFLSLLNLSNNNLSGRIPEGTQLQSFDASSFSGNKDLCGKPLTNNCSKDEFIFGASTDIVNAYDNDGLQMDWFYGGLGVGFIMGLWGIFSPLVLNRRWRYMYFSFLDHLGEKIYWSN